MIDQRSCAKQRTEQQRAFEEIVLSILTALGTNKIRLEKKETDVAIVSAGVKGGKIPYAKYLKVMFYCALYICTCLDL